ncbi:MAG: Gfo/Idh/MocA family oxidoreductase [Planctomycetes bacterium]|nr:Gfo/Idh/MocA family oxidoreductase [Planctomycetota bacterium]
MSQKIRYAIVGTGGRSDMFSGAIFEHYQEHAELAALCDNNQTRMDFYNSLFSEKYGAAALPTYKPDQFEQMISDNKIDTVIVTSIDRTHHTYIIRAMHAGCNVISEKPMTVDSDKCKDILKAIDETGKKLRVTFNYRYAPRNSKVKELLQSGVIGDVKSVHFEWLLNTEHGADYFRRWHRNKCNSGGLMVHKSTHHFDLVNWWLDSSPQEVFAYGGLVFYGHENAEARGEARPFTRGTGNSENDPFQLDLEKGGDRLKGLYHDAEHEDGYIRDQNVFGHGINIEDDMAVMVKYNSGATMSYHLTAYSPWEGYRIAFNGTKGRLEYDVEENSYISGHKDDANRLDVREGSTFEITEPSRILVRPLWEKPQLIEVETSEGGHGGGDKRLLDDIFLPEPEADPLHRAANHIGGCQSILTGIAANRSFQTGAPVRISSLLQDN